MFTRLLLDEFFHLIELLFERLIDDAMFVCLLDELILGLSYSDLTLETGGFELASTIVLVLQAKRLTKCAGHAKLYIIALYIILYIIYMLHIYYSNVCSQSSINFAAAPEDDYQANKHLDPSRNFSYNINIGNEQFSI